MMVFGNVIGEIAKRGYSKIEIADFLGISRNALSNKLICKTEFKKEEFDSMCEEFFSDLSIEYLSEKYYRKSTKTTYRDRETA